MLSTPTCFKERVAAKDKMELGDGIDSCRLFKDSVNYIYVYIHSTVQSITVSRVENHLISARSTSTNAATSIESDFESLKIIQRNRWSPNCDHPMFIILNKHAQTYQVAIKHSSWYCISHKHSHYSYHSYRLIDLIISYCFYIIVIPVHVVCIRT